MATGSIICVMLVAFKSIIWLLLPYMGNIGRDMLLLGVPLTAKLVMYSWRARAAESLATLELGPLKNV